MLCHLRHYWRRCFNRKDEAAGGISDDAIQLEYDLAFYREYAVQRHRPYKYPLRAHASETNLTHTCLEVN